MEGPIAKTAREAWEQLQKCGFEASGRDADLCEALRKQLDESSLSLEDAIDRASVDDFVLAFFRVAGGFTDMLKDLLRFFKRAEAKHGPQQWRIAFADFQEDVESFREWIRRIETSAEVIERPALSFAGCWELCDALQTPLPIGTAALDYANDRPNRDTTLASSWLSRLSPGEIPHIPPPPSAAPRYITDVWSCIVAALHILGEAHLTATGAAEYWRRRRPQYDRENGFALETLCFMETDYWLRSMVVAYALLVTSDVYQKEVQPHAEAVLENAPRTTQLVRVNLETFQTFISLPVWQRRYEFYAAWVATEMIRGMVTHDVEIHHENGAITLPFRETLVASVRSVSPQARLVAERKTPLQKPVGRSRKYHVKPDFGWWKGETPAKCGLIVEVKHYKKASSKPWSEILTDYARAHPNASVLLVNYGPAGRALERVPKPYSDRCRIIGDLRPGSTGAREALAKAVLNFVGQPLPFWPTTSTSPDLDAPVIVLDTSLSMSHQSRQRDLRALIISLISAEGAEWVAGADTELRGKWYANPDGFDQLMALDAGGGTGLARPLRLLLKDHRHAVLVTDDDGAASVTREEHLRCTKLQPKCAPRTIVLKVVTDDTDQG